MPLPRPKKLVKPVLFAAAASLILSIPSCKKKFQETPDKGASAEMKKMTEEATTNDYVFGPDNNPTEGYRYTELGRQYGHVFNIDNVRNAWAELTGENVELSPTHLYVRFVPQNIEELKRLTDANLATYTFPLDYEIVVPGDYMQDPSLEPNGIPPLYTCIPTDVPMPDVTHEVLDQMYILDMRSVVARKAFELAGEMETYPGPEPGEEVPQQFLTVNNGIAAHLCTYLDWRGRLSTDLVPEYPYFPPADGPANNINTPPSTVTNACGCNFNSDDRKPSGCIKVEETQWWDGTVRFEGVNDIMADFIGPHFQRLSPMTNANGCYKDDRIMRYKVWTPFGTIKLPVIMSAIFVSAKKTIKGLNHSNIMEYAAPMTHCIWSVQGGGLNHVNITYLRDWNLDHNETKYYTGATANNAIYDFDGYANQDGLMTTMNNLQVMVHKYHDAGSAPMFHKLLASGSIPAITVASFVVATVGALPVVGSTGIGSIMVAFPPDVTLGYKYASSMQLYTTDRLKEVAYHEYAHVIHYRKAGNHLWENNINYIAHYGLGANPYGNAGDPGSTRTDLIEMWGYYLGREYTHRRYGPNRHSRSGSPVFSNSWYAENEGDIFHFVHIPAGFLHDIRDNNTYNGAFSLWEAAGVNDAVRGFSTNTIYNQLGSGTTTASQLINTLGGMLPAGNTAGGYTNLKTSYGY
jgi:hypothetical protein